ncbi:MAG TPA: class I SAM-dependent methyltransferase [Candidatus Brocadiales bacterium]|nr:class I SAM-dependent methyltransferase [Candidatus Brocadiales bacterium]
MSVKTRCNFCNSDDYITLTQVIVSPIPETSWLVRCKRCGFTYINPKPTLERARGFYDLEYFKPGEEALWREDRYPLFEKVLSRIESTIPEGRLLDIGCGKGYFLDLARKRGWQGVGTDVSSTAIQFARDTLGLEVYMAELKDLKLPENSFDVATAWNVLDQIYDPWGNLREIFKALRSGGLIALRVSNLHFHYYLQHLSNLINSILSDSLKVTAPTVFHLYMFSPGTLEMLLREAGFVDIRVENSTLDPNVPALVNLAGKPAEVLLRNTTYLFAQTISYLSFGNLLISPSLVAFAKKP